VLLLVALACTACHQSRPTPEVIIIGVDGMDPGFVERHWNALPNLRSLKRDGSFGRLRTTTPPQSPVAWSSFITGLSPDQHGVYDFVQRDASTLEPYSSMSRTDPPRFVLPIGPYRLPLSSAHITSLRHGTPFWKVLSDRGIPVTVVRMPTNYPPVAAGQALAGMGTPDLRGTQGTFTFFTDDIEEISRDVAGGRIIAVKLHEHRATLPIVGPPNSLRVGEQTVAVDLIVDIDPEKPVARLRVGNNTAILKEGEWSDWLVGNFPLIRHVASVRGTFRVFAKQLHPDFQLYVSPVNIDPADPVLPISQPPSWSHTIARETGRFFTLGIPEDTAALRQNVFTLGEFEAQAYLVFEDERKLFRYSLQHFRNGLLLFYFSVLDQSSHMLWGRYEANLLNVYRAVDQCIGEARARHPNAVLMVMSDHGFTSFDRAVHLNAWLNHRGFLTMQSAAPDSSTLADIDWSGTEAYALGLNGLYLNRKGREAHGTVASGQQSTALLATLAEQLLAWRDPANGHSIILSVTPVHPSAENANSAPDLIVGYAPGYRASWQTGVGGTAGVEIEDNRDAWIGDHCVDASAVPGVLFTLRASVPGHASLEYLDKVILSLFDAG
jgi:predicted AlkP superfamily phosphohydrolase/phosphomutase